MFIAAIFVIVRSWKQPRCLYAKEWMQKMWFSYTMDTAQLLKLGHREMLVHGTRTYHH